MEPVLSALLELAEEAYPQLPKLCDYGKWLAGEFATPMLFVHAQQTGEAAGSLTGSRTVYTGLIALHFSKDETGARQPISAAPLADILRRERFQYPAVVGGERLVLNIDQGSFHIRLHERGDRLYVTFKLDVPAKIDRPVATRIENFQIETGG